MEEKLMPKWFLIWFILSCGLLIFGGSIDVFGGNMEGLSAIAAAIGILIMYLLVLVVWNYRIRIRKMRFLLLPIWLISVLSGWIFAEIDELINWPFNPLVPGISIVQDIVLTTPMYLLGHLAWFFVLKKYKFTTFQALITGGISIGLIEFFTGPSALAPVVWPFLVMIHGVHMVIPKIILKDKFEKLRQKDSIWKYFLGILLPMLGVLLGILVASIFAA